MIEKRVCEVSCNSIRLQTSRKQLYNIVQTRCDSKLLEKARSGNSEASVKELINVINERLEEKRRHEKTRCGLFTSKVRAFGARTDEFLKTFSGLIAIVKGIDENLGPIAFGTLSLFLAVATLKKQYMQTVVDTLESATNWLPRLEVIKALGAQTEQAQIGRQVFDIYQEFLIFLASVADHLQRSWLSRTRDVILKPPEYHLKPQEERIMGKTKLLLEEVLIQNWIQTTRATQARLDRQKIEHQNQQHLILTKLTQHNPDMRLVAADEDFPSRMIDQCRRMSRSGIFASYRRAAQPVVRLQEIHLDLLRQQRAYIEWATSSESALLIVAGQNYDDSGVSQSWVSPVAADFYASTRHATDQHQQRQDADNSNNDPHDDGRNTPIAAFCSTNALPYRRRRSHEDELQFLLLAILYQLLQADHRLCQATYQRLVALLDDNHNHDRSVDDEDDRIAASFALLAEVLSSEAARSQGRVVYIVLEGLERWSPPDAMRALVAGWLELFRDQHHGGRATGTTTAVKVLMTCSQRDSFPQIRNTQDRDELRHALGLGANRELMEKVFAVFLRQREIPGER